MSREQSCCSVLLLLIFGLALLMRQDEGPTVVRIAPAHSARSTHARGGGGGEAAAAVEAAAAEVGQHDAAEVGQHDTQLIAFAARTRLLLSLPATRRASRRRERSRASLLALSFARCASNCSGRGSCVRVADSTGGAAYCLCAPGWAGDACDVRDPSPCNAPDGGRVLSRCAGHCDEDVNRCICGEGSAFPRRPMRGCQYEGVEKERAWLTPAWGSFVRGPKAAFWSGGGGGQPGWCDAESGRGPRPPRHCACYDGANGGSLCTPTRPFCVNQCGGAGRGECRDGYCVCARDLAGADCSVPSGGGEGGTAAAGVAVAAAAVAEAGSTAADSASGGAAAGGRSSPRVYVYEVPPRYNSLLLARRLVHDACALRTYEGKGAQQDAPAWTSNLYGAEVALHEALLASPHRTHAPEEADYFFVPVYVGCFVSEFNRPYPTHWLCDGCHQHSGGGGGGEAVQGVPFKRASHA